MASGDQDLLWNCPTLLLTFAWRSWLCAAPQPPAGACSELGVLAWDTEVAGGPACFIAG